MVSTLQPSDLNAITLTDALIITDLFQCEREDDPEAIHLQFDLFRLELRAGILGVDYQLFDSPPNTVPVITNRPAVLDSTLYTETDLENLVATLEWWGGRRIDFHLEND